MRDFAEIEADLRFAADNGCDYTLLIEAAEALAKENELIQKLAGIVVRNAQIRINVDEVKEDADQIERDATEKSEKAVYLQMEYYCGREEMKDLQNYLNKESPDKIVVLPTYVKMLNPEDTEKVLKEFLNIQSPSEECKKHAEERIVQQLMEWLDGFAARAKEIVGGESNDNIT